MCALSLPLCANLLGQRWQAWGLVSSTVNWLLWSFSCSRRLDLLPNSRPHCNQTYMTNIGNVRRVWNSYCSQPSMWNWLTLVTKVVCFSAYLMILQKLYMSQLATCPTTSKNRYYENVLQYILERYKLYHNTYIY